MNTPDKTLSDLTLFVCTYVAKLDNLNISFEKLTDILCNNLSGNILAINSNFGHASQLGYEELIKSPKQESDKKCTIKKRTRKVQGDGTCFNSAIEPIIKLKNLNIQKNYFIKCFPTTGETQIPGVIREDFLDGHEILTIFVDFLNDLNLGVKDENNIPKKIYIKHEGPKMLNYKFKLIRVNENILINLINVATYLLNNTNESLDWIYIPFPFEIKEIKLPVDDIKISFKFRTSDRRSPRINIFQEGKINILGAETVESAHIIYKFIYNMFKHNWNKLISIKPEKDKL
jgi:hypothetical protein